MKSNDARCRRARRYRRRGCRWSRSRRRRSAGIEREIYRREPRWVAAVAGAVGAQRLAIGEGILAVGVALAGGRCGAVDMAAVIDLGRARRTERLAELRRRCVAAHRQRKIFANAAAHTTSGPGTRHARGQVGADVAVPVAEVKPNGLAKKLACGGACRPCCFREPPKNRSNSPSAETESGHDKPEPANAAAASITRRRRRPTTTQLCAAQRQLHPTRYAAATRSPGGRIHHSAGWQTSD